MLMRLVIKLFCFFLLLSGGDAFAQKDDSVERNPISSHYQKTKRSTYVATNIPLEATDVETLKKIVADFFADEIPSGVSLVLMRQKESPVPYHYRFQQMYRGFPVYNAFADLVVSKKGILKSICHSLEWNLPEQVSTNVDSEFLARSYCENISWDLDNTPTQMIFHSELNDAQSAVVFNIVNSHSIVKIVVLDLQGKELFSDILTQMYHSDTPMPATGNVFVPDPLTSAGVGYGGAFMDNDDQTNASLNGEMKQVDLETCVDDAGVYHLRNDVLKIVDFDSNGPSPNTNVPPPTSTTGEFLFDRSESGFEAVNAFYHITTMQRHMDALGYTLPCPTLLEVDARAPGDSDDDDNSSYNPSLHRLKFGTGGIDDAEDADVCVHEYGHALSYCANENGQGTDEREAIEEGLCDYFAASYSKAISGFQSDRVFNWDGNFGNWSGRTVSSFKQYPTDLADNQYSDAPIWSSVMMEIWDELGRDVTDQLMMQAMYAFTSATDMPTAAQFVLDADEMLNDCENFDVLMRYFHKRGMLDFTADAGEDKEICIGESAVLGGKLSNLFNSSVEWTPSIGLDDPDTLFPTASPPTTTTYTVTVTDNLRNEVYTDGVTVKVKPCLTELYSDQVEVVNSNDLGLYGTGAFIRFPEEALVEGIFVYDSSGRLVTELETNTDNLPVALDFSAGYTGIYILEVRMAEESKVFKLLSGR